MGRLSYDLDELEPLTRSSSPDSCGFVQRVILFGSVNEQVCRMSPVSNEYVLYTLAQVATTLAGFSGLVVVFRVRGAQAWSRAELRTFWFLLGDSFLVLFFSLIPLPLALVNCSQDALWGLCNGAFRLLVCRR